MRYQEVRETRQYDIRYTRKCKIPDNTRYHIVPNTRQYDMPIRVRSNASVQGTVISVAFTLLIISSIFFSISSISIPSPSPIEYLVDICPNKMLKSWDWDAILEKSNTLSLDFLVKHKHRFRGNLWARISSHPNLTIEFINKHYTRYHKKPFYWNLLSSHPNITMEIIDENPDKPWDWQFGVSNNPNFTTVSYTHLTLPTNREV